MTRSVNAVPPIRMSLAPPPPAPLLLVEFPSKPYPPPFQPPANCWDALVTPFVLLGLTAEFVLLVPYPPT